MYSVGIPALLCTVSGRCNKPNKNLTILMRIDEYLYLGLRLVNAGNNLY